MSKTPLGTGKVGCHTHKDAEKGDTGVTWPLDGFVEAELGSAHERARTHEINECLPRGYRRNLVGSGTVKRVALRYEFFLV